MVGRKGNTQFEFAHAYPAFHKIRYGLSKRAQSTWMFPNMETADKSALVVPLETCHGLALYQPDSNSFVHPTAGGA